LRTFLDWHESKVARTIVHPQEQIKLQVLRCWLDEYIQLIKKYVPTVPAELIFNIDETGLSDWEERKDKPVLIPSDQIEATLHYQINKSLRHHTLTCCISAAGDAYCPLLIALDRGQRAFLTGVRRGIDLMMEIHQPANATAEIYFRYWIYSYSVV
jgi:hypothetical protein